MAVKRQFTPDVARLISAVIVVGTVTVLGLYAGEGGSSVQPAGGSRHFIGIDITGLDLEYRRTLGATELRLASYGITNLYRVLERPSDVFELEERRTLGSGLEAGFVYPTFKDQNRRRYIFS